MTNLRRHFVVLAAVYVCFWIIIAGFAVSQWREARDGFNTTVEQGLAKAEPDENGWIEITSKSTPDLLKWDKRSKAALNLFFIALAFGVAAPVALGMLALAWWIFRRAAISYRSKSIGYQDPPAW